MRYFTGIDIGSTASKVVVLDGEGLVERFVLPTGWSSKDTSREIRRRLAELGTPVNDEMKVIATGYGRISVDYADKVVTEITCHGRGGYSLLGRDCSIIDIGGQDTKVITVEKGATVSFLMNDKCAAGTGKFLEIMANRLGVELGEMFAMAARGKPLAISSMCTVFAESEVISQLSKGTDKRDIINGIHQSVAGRVAGLAHRIGIQDQVVMTGGVAQNKGVVKALEEELGCQIHTSPLTQYNGALGAALFAFQKYQKEQKA